MCVRCWHPLATATGWKWPLLLQHTQEQEILLLGGWHKGNVSAETLCKPLGMNQPSSKAAAGRFPGGILCWMCTSPSLLVPLCWLLPNAGAVSPQH